MKKRSIIGIITIAAIAVTAGFVNQKSNPYEGLSELNIANIEALANPEYGSSSITAYCNPLSVNVHVM